MGRPVIGICAGIERARWSVWDQEAFLLPRSYIDAIQRSGGLALIIPPDEKVAVEPDDILDMVDALVLAGGRDIDPRTYGAKRHKHTAKPTHERDSFEIALARRALERDMPLLGICRGMQLLNVAQGGTLHQHLPDKFGHHEHRKTPGTFDGADHDVRLAAGSLAARAAGEELHATKSHHHQGVDRVGEGLEVTGWSTIDELPEAVEMPDRRFVLGVQWHPEADDTSRLIEALVAEAASVVAD